MISFKNSLEIQKISVLAEECFALMEIYNIKSMNFVDWLEDCQNKQIDIVENINIWLDTEINFLENYKSAFLEVDGNPKEEQPITFSQSWKQDMDALKKMMPKDFLNFSKSPVLQGGKELLQGGKQFLQGASQKMFQGAANLMQKFGDHLDVKKIKNNVEASKQKLIDLLKRGEREGSILNNEKIKSAITSVVNYLQKLDSQTIQKIAAMPQKHQNESCDFQELRLVKKEHIDNDLSHKITNDISTDEVAKSRNQDSIKIKLLETKIKSACYKLDELKINPYYFATCFVSEFCEDNNINESNWLGGAWAGLKGAVKGGWDKLMGGGEGSFWDSVTKGYRSGRDTKYDDYDRTAISDAINHLKSFSQQIQGSTLEKFVGNINGLVNSLNKTLSFKAQSQAPQQQGVEEPVNLEPQGANTSDTGTGAAENPWTTATKKQDENPWTTAGKSSSSDSTSSQKPETAINPSDFVKNYNPKKSEKVMPRLKNILKDYPKVAEEIFKTDEFKSVMQNLSDNKKPTVSQFSLLNSKIDKILKGQKEQPTATLENPSQPVVQPASTPVATAAAK